MESLSRPPHRRKHASVTNSFASFSMKTPHDDVLVSGGGAKSKPFGAQEYAEIFSGSSSSIPVLDLPGLDERVGSGGGFSSKLDYSNIFGGLRDDDLAVPYEELFNRARKTKFSSSKTCVPSDPEIPVQESFSIHSGNTKPSSGESADQLVNGVKQQFNLAFNKTSQNNNDPSKGKTHIAQLHAVPGFTYFIDGAHRSQNAEDDRPVRLLKRDVSRTWSFSSDVEAVKGRGSSCVVDSQNHDKSQNMTESILKPHISDVPPPSNRPYNLREHNNFKGSRTSSFPPKEDSSGKIGDDPSPPLFRDELDENSVAAISAAALKRAMDQAQESIRLAKMRMEKKKEGPTNGSKPRSKGRLTVKDTKGNGIDIETNSSKERNVRETLERLDPIFPACKELYAKVDPPLNQIMDRSDSRKVELEKERNNVETAKEHGEEFNGVGEKFFTSCSQGETLHDIDVVELELHEKNVQATLEYTEIDRNNNLIFALNKLALNHEKMENVKETSEQREVPAHYTKCPDNISEVERAECTFETTQKLKNVAVGALKHGKLMFDSTQAPENDTEVDDRALNISQSTIVKENVGDAGANLRISQEDEVTDKSQNVTRDRGQSEWKIEESEEVVDVEHLKFPETNFDNFMNDQPNMNEKYAIEQKKDAVEQEEIVNKFASVLECGENGHRNGKGCDEEERSKGACAWVETEEKLKEIVEENIDEMGPKVFPEMEEVEVIVNGVNEPENVRTAPNYSHGENSEGISSAFEQNESYVSYMGTSKNEADETKQMEVNNCAKFQKSEVPHGAEKANILVGTEKSEENLSEHEFQVPAYEMDSEAVDDRSDDACSIFKETQSNNASSIFNANQKSCDINFDDGNKDNSSVPVVVEKCSVSDSETKAEQLFQFKDNGMRRTDSLRRNASDNDFVGSNRSYAFEGLSFDHNMENVDDVNTNNEEKLPEEENIFKSTSEIHSNIQETGDKFYYSPGHQSVHRTDRYNLNDVELASEQTSESDGISDSSSIPENTEVFSVHKSAENAKNEASDKEEVEDIDITFDKINRVEHEVVYTEEQSEDVYSQLHSQRMHSFLESERKIETDQSFEKTSESINGTSTMEEKLAKENLPNFDKEDQQQRIEAIKKGRAREKDRLAVERAMREARERAFAEARERAERAAVERVASEVRQRVMAETQEKLEKAATVTKQTADKASAEAKIRSERAAVERATVEARERALEKAMSQKTTTEGRAHADRYPTESSRNNGLKHSFSSSDLEKFDGTSNESAQRRKARLERHQRIMERAAKALAEKNMRDLLAQKEQAERNRLAESLDADIKRWVIGKEGNLRALLSTLQYILGTNSGWQPISLTEILTTPAVKKAYRKATLYVHPDKLQQRGASIQQKYICEKVFYLLKAAWNKFNSEER